MIFCVAIVVCLCQINEKEKTQMSQLHVKCGIFSQKWTYLDPRLPKSSKYLMSRYLDPLKAEPQEVFVGPNTDPHKVFGRLGIENASVAIQTLFHCRFWCQQKIEGWWASTYLRNHISLSNGKIHFPMVKHTKKVFERTTTWKYFVHFLLEGAVSMLFTKQKNNGRWIHWISPITPWKFNMAPENVPSQKESSLPTIIFQGLC